MATISGLLIPLSSLLSSLTRSSKIGFSRSTTRSWVNWAPEMLIRRAIGALVLLSSSNVKVCNITYFIWLENVTTSCHRKTKRRTDLKFGIIPFGYRGNIWEKWEEDLRDSCGNFFFSCGVTQLFFFKFLLKHSLNMCLKFNLVSTGLWYCWSCGLWLNKVLCVYYCWWSCVQCCLLPVVLLVSCTVRYLWKYHNKS